MFLSSNPVFITSLISSNEFKFKPLIDGILSIEFYAGNEYLGNIEFKATKHGKGFIFE